MLIIIDHKGQRFVGGSQAILDMYNSGLIKPTQTDQKYAEDAVSTSAETNFTGVQPLENTSENLMLDHRLANVLGHSSSSQAPPRRCLPYSHSSSEDIPRPVQDLLKIDQSLSSPTVKKMMCLQFKGKVKYALFRTKM